MGAVLSDINQAVIEGRGPGIRGLTEKALGEGHSAEKILEGALLPAMEKVGKFMKQGEYYIPEVLVASRTMQMAIDVLNPHLVDPQQNTRGTVVIGTVQGDLHDIGKNLVRMMLEGAGFAVVDLGTDVSAEAYLGAVKEHNADILAMSALLTTTMPVMREIITHFSEAGIRDQIKVLVGGAALTQSYASDIGADGYAHDAATAVDVATALLK
jgi:5-methyltetrahydrofolate--homocysteine methyltransferase